MCHSVDVLYYSITQPLIVIWSCLTTDPAYSRRARTSLTIVLDQDGIIALVCNRG